MVLVAPEPAPAHHCWPGTAAGAWRAYEWVLDGRGTSDGPTTTAAGTVTTNAAVAAASSRPPPLPAACAPLRKFIHAETQLCGKKVPSTVPNAPPSNLRSCTRRDEPLLERELANASILMVGDSTSAQVLWHTCEAFGARPSSFIAVDPRAHNLTSLKAYSHRLRSLDNHACRLPGGLLLGSFSHYGATGPPYWAFAYPLAPWLANTTAGMARHDMPKVRALTRPTGADPTLIVASSGFWDIASWWANEGNFSKGWSCLQGGAAGSGGNHTASYVAGVKRLVHELRRAFPSSVVAWRLMHPGQKHSITPRVVSHLNAAIRKAAPGWRLPLVDVETMVARLSKSEQPNLGRGPPYGTADGRHLHPFINMALLNLLLNLARSRPPYAYSSRQQHLLQRERQQHHSMYQHTPLESKEEKLRRYQERITTLEQQLADVKAHIAEVHSAHPPAASS